MSHRLNRRAFSAGIALGIPAALLGKTAASQSFFDPNGAALDLESVLLRVRPYDVMDYLIAAPFGDAYQASRWADISQTPYFSSVGGVVVQQAASSTAIGAYGIYLAPAGARAGQYLGRRALEKTITGVQAQVVGGYAAEVLTYDEGDSRTLTQVPVGNVMVLGYDGDTAGASVANANLLVAHLQEVLSS